MNSQENASSVASLHRDLIKINLGLHVLRSLLASSTPGDFEWWFTFNEGEVFAGWAWRGGSYQNEIRCVTATQLLEEWEAVSWENERVRAREWECVS